MSSPYQAADPGALPSLAYLMCVPSAILPCHSTRPRTDKPLQLHSTGAQSRQSTTCLASTPSWPAQGRPHHRRWPRSPATATRRCLRAQRPPLDDTLTADRPSAGSQSVPPGHPSFRRQRASRACESESSISLRVPFQTSAVQLPSYIAVSTLVMSLGTSASLKTNANHDDLQHATQGRSVIRLDRRDPRARALTAIPTGPLRRRLTGHSVHQLHRLLHRMPHSAAQAEEDAGHSNQGRRQVGIHGYSAAREVTADTARQRPRRER